MEQELTGLHCALHHAPACHQEPVRGALTTGFTLTNNLGPGDESASEAGGELPVLGVLGLHVLLGFEGGGQLSQEALKYLSGICFSISIIDFGCRPRMSISEDGQECLYRKMAKNVYLNQKTAKNVYIEDGQECLYWKTAENV